MRFIIIFIFFFSNAIAGEVPNLKNIVINEKLKKYDAYLAMFHDQGLPVLKSMGFGDSVNITLGLPFTRVSVDHGTAYELAGKNKADPSSFKKSMELALEFCS